jgi:competence protein ComGC
MQPVNILVTIMCILLLIVVAILVWIGYENKKFIHAQNKIDEATRIKLIDQQKRIMLLESYTKALENSLKKINQGNDSEYPTLARFGVKDGNGKR